MSEWHVEAGGLVKFDLLMPRVEFRFAGNTSGPNGPIPLVEHTCARPGPAQGCMYVSAMPSADDDPYVVPFCGCRPVNG